MTALTRCLTSYGATRDECTVWLNADTLCFRKLGHWPESYHRGYDPSGSGQWIDCTEKDGQAIEVARGKSFSAPVADEPAQDLPSGAPFVPAVAPVPRRTGISRWLPDAFAAALERETRLRIAGEMRQAAAEHRTDIPGGARMSIGLERAAVLIAARR